MNQSVLGWLLVLALASAAAHAQQAAGNLNATQLLCRQTLAQSCGICHLQPARNSVTYGPLLNQASAGGNDEAMRTFIVNGTERMPAFRHYLKPAEIDAIIAYLKTVPAPVALAPAESKKGESR